LNDPAERDLGPLVELLHRAGGGPVIDREDHLLSGNQGAADVAHLRSLAAHLFHHLAGPAEGLEKLLAGHSRPVTLDQVCGHAILLPSTRTLAPPGSAGIP